MITRFSQITEISHTKDLVDLFVLLNYSSNYDIVFVYKDTGELVDNNSIGSVELDTSKGTFILKDEYFPIRRKIVTGNTFTCGNVVVTTPNYMFSKEPEAYTEVYKPLNKFITYGHEDVIYYVAEVKATTMKVTSKYNETLEVNSSVDINEWTPKENEMFVYVSNEGKLSIGVNSPAIAIEDMKSLVVMPYGFDVDAYTSYLNSLKGDNND